MFAGEEAPSQWAHAERAAAQREELAATAAGLEAAGREGEARCAALEAALRQLAAATGDMGRHYR